MSHRTFTLEEIEAASADMEGFCIECGSQQTGVEPDARKYKCENCDKMTVYGADELVLMGLVH